MQRRAFIKTACLGIGATMLAHQTPAQKTKHPNLLFVFPDQMRREAMEFWNTNVFKGTLETQPDPVVTPTLNKLAEESVVFTQAVSTCPVCSPYRAMFMSGMYPWRNGVTSNCHQTREDGLHHTIPCFTDVLSQAGYETCYVGKTHWEQNKPLFDENGNYVGTTDPPGGHHMNAFDTYIPPGRGRHSNAYWFQCVKDAHKDPRVYASDPNRIQGKTDGEQHRPKIYSPKLEADVLIDYLKNASGQRDTSKPFSIIWSINPPHSPYGSEKDCDENAYRKHYKDKSPQELLVRPNVIEGESREKAEKCAPFYFANVTGLDKQLGRVLQALEESGEADNTLIVFTSDHGEMMGSQGRFGKLVLYEEAYCVPFMVKYPGRTKQSLEDLMIGPVDIMPTLLGMLGLTDQIPETVEGKNYAQEILTGNWSTQPKPKSALFLGYNNRIKGLRTDRYSFQIDNDGNQLLFDRETDPYQQTELTLSDIPKTESDFILSELAHWLKTSDDPWYQKRKFADLIPYPA